MTLHSGGGGMNDGSPGLRMGRLHTAICLLTRRRPIMLGKALASLEAMRIPANTHVTVIVVENDEQETVQAMLDSFGRASGHAVIYALEPVMGIPFARNRALEAALETDADAILFFDDDETVDEEWLCAMVQRYRESGLDLIGGPVAISPSSDPEPRLQQVLRNGMEGRFARRAEKAKQKMAKGQDGRITIVTNNWLASREMLETGLRFDSAYAKTGGSDTKFYHDAIAIGFKSGWAPDAKVYETIPSERLTVGYVYQRGRDQKRTSVYRKLRKSGRIKSGLRMVPEMGYRAAALIPGLIYVVLSGGQHLTSFVRDTSIVPLSCGGVPVTTAQ